MVIQNIKKEDAGNYSCVFSDNEYEPTEVKGVGDNYVLLQVFDDYLPGNLALGNNPARKGEDAELKCTVSDPQSLDRESPTVYACLYKDGVGVQIQLWDREKLQATFTIPRVSKESNGNYSCALFDQKILSRTLMELQGNNTVLLQVESRDTCGNESLYITSVGLGVIVFLLAVALLLEFWRSMRITDKGNFASHCHREQAEENENETQIQDLLINIAMPDYATVQDTLCSQSEPDELMDFSETEENRDDRIYHVVECVFLPSNGDEQKRGPFSPQHRTFRKYMAVPTHSNHTSGFQDRREREVVCECMYVKKHVKSTPKEQPGKYKLRN
ncbi:uncharacterized protein LOC108940902 [Scleropages formosus]|uniref:uncharacterized protein LOC108940902 n=1 Tax=Scleropages formosus TaxID=113540 RepID=UPI0010FACA3F|nr:uncharacterized protein LOC108940902 [Scleropages formosus]